tara:strand:- start:409 stop:912 length:504 start_codon:yes stop_codon:yes gene_type:complete
MKIRLAKNDDIKRIVEIANACADHMISKGIFQWDKDYPNKETFKTDLDKGTLFTIEDKHEILGCICISLNIDEFYKSVKWITETNKNVYVHRLAIHPQYQGRGLALKLMDYANEFAIQNNCESIRLDTFSGNPRNNKFYTLQGYTKIGEIYFRNQSEMPFNCYEKIL